MSNEVDLSPSAIRSLQDRLEIQDVLARYCRGVDRVDPELINSAFHEDATCEFGSLNLKGAEIGEAVSTASGSAVICHHMTGNHVADVHGDVAHSETYYFASVVTDEGGGRYLRQRAGRYVDRFERRRQEWRIAERVVVQDWGSLAPLSQLPPEGSFRQGQQDGTDALYALIGPRVHD
jgi:hypothetical protein